MSPKDFLILIPARYHSTRFEGKPLAKIAKKPMIQWVYESMKETGRDVFVVTDHPLIEQAVLSFGGDVVRVDDDVACGTDRIYLAYERYFKELGYKLLINVQGDEPLLKASEVIRLGEFHLAQEFEITTLVKKRHGEELEDWRNPNIVKAHYSESARRCLSFSRAAIPSFRDEEKKRFWFQHIGVYSYKTKALESFVKAPMGELESIEKLEQLRALEIGFSLGAITTDLTLIGVDTPDDLKRVEGLFYA